MKRLSILMLLLFTLCLITPVQEVQAQCSTEEACPDDSEYDRPQEIEEPNCAWWDIICWW